MPVLDSSDGINLPALGTPQTLRPNQEPSTSCETSPLLPNITQEDSFPSLNNNPKEGANGFDYAKMQYTSLAFVRDGSVAPLNLNNNTRFPSRFVSRVKKLSASVFRSITATNSDSDDDIDARNTELLDRVPSFDSLPAFDARLETISLPSVGSSASGSSSHSHRSSKSSRSRSRSRVSRSSSSSSASGSRQSNTISSVMAIDGVMDRDSFDPEQAFNTLVTFGPPSQPVQPKFRVVDALGRGGFSIVLKVIDVDSGDSYAMKKIKKENYSKSLRMKRQLGLELQVMRELSASPFMQPIEYIFEDELFLYIILEELHGDLFYHLSTMENMDRPSQHLGKKKSKILLAEVCLALEHLHSHNFVHRDLKLENLVMDKRGHIKLIDFGLATRCDSDVQPMHPVGSIAIMAPELIKEHTGGRHTDWWAYGVLAFELLTGKSPWSTVDDVQQTYYEICHVDFRPSRTRSKTATEFICSLLTRDFRKRLGTVSSDPTNSVRNSNFFKSVKWDDVAAQRNRPAFIPNRHGACPVSETEKNEILGEHQAALLDMQLTDFHWDDEPEEEDDDDETTAAAQDETRFNSAKIFGITSPTRMSHRRQKQEKEVIPTVWNLGYPHVSKFLVD